MSENRCAISSQLDIAQYGGGVILQRNLGAHQVDQLLW